MTSPGWNGAPAWCAGAAFRLRDRTVRLGAIANDTAHKPMGQCVGPVPSRRLRTLAPFAEADGEGQARRGVCVRAHHTGYSDEAIGFDQQCCLGDRRSLR